MNNNLFITFFIGLVFAFTACGEESKNQVTVNPPKVDTILPNNKVIYEINVRNFSAQGNFSGVEKDIPRLKELGVDILWLMPIHPIGEKNRIGTKGSPYSVKDYLSINPDYGTADDLKSLISTAHKAKMEIWLDWVANHTAWDNTWVTEHIDYYASQNGQRPYSPSGWNDVVQLDFTNQNMRAAMINAMKYWVQEFDIDGFRCDYATGVPVDFWKSARTAIESIKKITWLAEGDNPSYMSVFDWDYAWAYNTSLNDFGQDNNVTKLKTACTDLFNNPNYKSKSRMVYLTNHDLNAYNGTISTRFGNNVLPLTVLYFTIYDMPLIFNGQEVGDNKSMGLFDVNPVAWTPVNTTVQNLLAKLTQLKRSQPALENGTNRGTLVFYNTTNDQVFAYSRKRGTNDVLTLLNFSNAPVSFKFSGTYPAGTFTNYLGSGTQSFNTSDNIQLSANGYAIYLK